MAIMEKKSGKEIASEKAAAIVSAREEHRDTHRRFRTLKKHGGMTDKDVKDHKQSRDEMNSKVAKIRGKK